MNILRKIKSVIGHSFRVIQKSMEASAYSRILNNHGSQLDADQREYIRKRLVDIIQSK